MSNAFATAISCMDGRIQIPVIEYIKRQYGVSYVDMITEPGPNKTLSKNRDTPLIALIKKRVTISVEAHGSKLIAVVGHHDCAGNPADKDTQVRHIRDSIGIVKKWGFSVRVIGLWIDEKWQVHDVSPGT